MLALSEAAAQVLPLGRRLLKLVTVGLAVTGRLSQVQTDSNCLYNINYLNAFAVFSPPQIVIAPHVEGKVPPHSRNVCPLFRLWSFSHLRQV